MASGERHSGLKLTEVYPGAAQLCKEDRLKRHHHLAVAGVLVAFTLSGSALLALVLGRRWFSLSAETAAAILAAHLVFHWIGVGLGGTAVAGYGWRWLHSQRRSKYASTGRKENAST